MAKQRSRRQQQSPILNVVLGVPRNSELGNLNLTQQMQKNRLIFGKNTVQTWWGRTFSAVSLLAFAEFFQAQTRLDVSLLVIAEMQFAWFPSPTLRISSLKLPQNDIGKTINWGKLVVNISTQILHYQQLTISVSRHGIFHNPKMRRLYMERVPRAIGIVRHHFLYS